MSSLSDEEFISLLEAAVLAPSADNRHLFQLERTKPGLRLWVVDGYLNAPPHVRILALISFGAVAENMRLRGKRLGLSLDFSWFPPSETAEILAHIRMTRVAAKADALEAMIAERQTNRHLWFHGPPLSTDQIRTLESDVLGLGVELAWFDSPALRRQLVRIIKQAEIARFTSPELHAELFGAMRFDVGWNATADQGLPPGALCVEAAMQPIFAWFRSWRLLRSLNRVGMHHVLGLRAADLPCRFAPHLAVLAVRGDPASGAIPLGAAFERIWLRATALGLSLQPLAGAPLLALAGYAPVPADFQRRLLDLWGKLLPDLTPLMVFRLGRAAPAKVRTGRRALETYIKPAAT